jgi:U4/U6 small nuclear ribonucleoprotein PRP4
MAQYTDTRRYQVATGSGDDTVKIWDLRALKAQYTIPAHKSSVSDLKFFRSTAESPFLSLDSSIPSSASSAPAPALAASNGSDPDGDATMDLSTDTPRVGPNVRSDQTSLPKSGLYLVTAGFDCNVRIWSADEWTLVRNLATDAGKVMSVDISGDGEFIASASYSRSFHLFGKDKDAQ